MSVLFCTKELINIEPMALDCPVRLRFEWPDFQLYLIFIQVFENLLAYFCTLATDSHCRETSSKFFTDSFIKLVVTNIIKTDRMYCY